MTSTGQQPPSSSPAATASEALLKEQPPSSSAAPAAPEALLKEPTAQEVAQRCVEAMTGAVNCLCMSIGHKLGLFGALQAMGPCSPSQLAAAAGGLSERWVREWLYQQTAAGFVSSDKEAASFWLAEGQAAVLVECPDNPRVTPLEMVCMMPTILGKSAEHCHCFQTGQGMTFDEFGTEHMFFGHRLAKAQHFVKQLQSLPGLHQKLTEGVKVADVGCGSGEIMLHFAATYPACTCVGYDTSAQALSLANKRKAERGLTNLTFLNPQDGPECQLPSTPTFHLVLVQDSLHDMSHPQHMLEAIRKAMLSSSSSSDGRSNTDQATDPESSSRGVQQQADALAGYNGDPALVVSDKSSTGHAATNITSMPAAGLMYGYSVALCLASGMSEEGGAGLGTLGFHEGVARQMSSAAGFSSYSPLGWATSGDHNSYHLFRP